MNAYKYFVFIFVAISLSFSTVEAKANKKKLVGAKTVAKMNKKVKMARVPAAKDKVPAGIPTKLPAKIQASEQAQGPVSFRAPASTGISDSQKSLEIRGQARNLSMLLVLKNRHENIDFVKPRESYREEIQRTDF